MKYLFLSILKICLCISRAHTQSIDEVNPVEEMVWLSDLVKDTLYVRIVLPKVYHRIDTTYPMILHLDSDVSLDLITSISNWLTLTGKINPMIIVGIAYKKDWQQKRARDMTPVRGELAFQKARPQSGMADNFLGAIQEELYPALEKYRIDWHDKTLTGHSLGGLLAFYTLIDRPALFDKYLLVAPAVNWYDNYALQLIDNMNDTPTAILI